MTTDHDARLAALASKRRPRLSAKRQATVGKILTAGLTSTTVFGITASLGWSAADTNQGTDQVVFDQATGIITVYREGQVVSTQLVAAPPSMTTATMTTPVTTTPAAAEVAASAPSGFPALAPSITPAPAATPVTITIPIAVPAPQPAPPPQASSSGSN